MTIHASTEGSGSIAATVASVAGAIAVAAFKDEAFAPDSGLSTCFSLANATTNPGQGRQSGYDRASNQKSSGPQEHFAHVFASSPNFLFEGTLR